LNQKQTPIDQKSKGISHEPRATSNELHYQPPATSHIIPERSGRYQLLWTSGWDSTFRLLQLTLDLRVPVQPIYLIDPNKRSYPIEIMAMYHIKNALTQVHPHTADLILPTWYFSVADLQPDAEIEAATATARQERHFGDQYPWIAKFCKQHNLSRVEIGVIRGDSLTTHNDIRPYLDPNDPANVLLPPNHPVTSTIEAISSSHEPISSSHERRATNYELFKFLSFPIINLSKTDMLSRAQNNGWFEFMELTWFCVDPVDYDTPCGKCIPCTIAKNEGMGWRFEPEMPDDPETLEPDFITLKPRPFHMKVYNRLRRTFSVLIGEE